MSEATQKHGGRNTDDLSAKPQVLLIPPSEVAFGRELQQGVAEYAWHQGGWDFHAIHETGWAFAPAPDLAAWSGDGIVLPVTNAGQLEHLDAAGIPFVNVTAWPGIPTVSNDNAAIGRLGANHLLERGFRDFAFLGVPDTIYARQRREAFVATVRDQGHQCSTHEGSFTTGEDWTWERVGRDLAEWVTSLPRPIAVMASNDTRARQLLETARRAGITVPEEMAVLGVDDDDALCALCRPPLSSVRLDGQRVGYEAAAMLDRLMRGESPPAEPVLIPPDGITSRVSTRTYAFDDPDVATAVEFIRGNAHRPIQVDDVADRVPMSRRTLERRFREALGHSPWQEIRRRQIEHVKRLLAETDWNMARIALKSAFSSAKHLGEVFRRETGQPPGQFRRTHRTPP